MEAPAWAVGELHEGERVVWAQDISPGAFWMVAGPLVGAGFALVYAGSAVTDLPGRWEWLTGDLGERLGVAPTLLAIAGGAGFVMLVSKEAALYAFTRWVVTDARLVRSVRFAPWLTKSWPLRDVEVRSVRTKKDGAKVKLRVPGRWGRDTLTLDAREGGAMLAGALRAAAPP